MRARSPFAGTIALGLALMPVVCGLTFCSLTAISEAAMGPGLAQVDLSSLQHLAVNLGLMSEPATAESIGASLQPIPSAIQAPADTWSAPPTPFPPPPSATDPATPSSTLTATASSTATETMTPTPTDTTTETPTGTSTDTPTETITTTATPTPTATRTRTPTVAPTVTPSRTPSATPSVTRTPIVETPSPTWEAPATATGAIETGTATTSPSDTPSPPTETPRPTCDASGNAEYESALLALINQERQRQGLAAYNLQSQLQAAAREHSSDMACNDFLSHTGSDGSRVGDRVRRRGYDWSWVGENIFATGDTSASAPQQAFDWWMNSAPHRANLLSPNYADIGLGYVYSASSSYGGYFTAVFARP